MNIKINTKEITPEGYIRILESIKNMKISNTSTEYYLKAQIDVKNMKPEEISVLQENLMQEVNIENYNLLEDNIKNKFIINTKNLTNDNRIILIQKMKKLFNRK